jgi:glycosyltransferase involved in cell wall biosynthesis
MAPPQSSAGMLPVSTVLLTRNSMASLPAYLESMREVDDIIVLDGGSTDGTLELLKKQPNCRVFPQNPKYLDADGRIVDFSSVRNEGYALARHRWILCVDADESASPKLLAEVRRVVEENEPGVYAIRRRFLHRGRPVVILRKSATDQIRLFHLDRVRGCVRPVHERLDILPGTKRGMLDVDVDVPLPDAADARKKYDRYLAIEVRHNRGITFRRWFRWILLRTLVSIPRRIGVIVLMRLIPKPGPRYPLALEWEQMRYSVLLTWRTWPLRRG